MQEHHTDDKTSYRPLGVVIGVILLASAALQFSNGAFNAMQFMQHVMGLFFLIFAMFKFFNLDGFADGFQMYDIIAKKFRPYAYAYPVIELTLGTLYLSNHLPLFTNIATIAIMAISAAGVFLSMVQGNKFKCACLGTVLNVPLSTISLVENVGAGIMAVYMIGSL
jgi:hypothetical protein